MDVTAAFWRVPADVPLPPFSPELLPMLRSPRPLDHFTRLKMAGIAASFYFLHYDQYLCNRSAYRLVGERLMEEYPALMAEGPHPWTSFVKAMSYKVRRKRFQCRHSQGEVTMTRVQDPSSKYGFMPLASDPSFQEEDDHHDDGYRQRACDEPPMHSGSQ